MNGSELIKPKEGDGNSRLRHACPFTLTASGAPCVKRPYFTTPSGRFFCKAMSIRPALVRRIN